MANKVDQVEQGKDTLTPLTDAGMEMATKHRYVPSLTSNRQQRFPRWLAIPILSPLRRLTRTGFWPYIAILGPGIVAAAAGNDAGGIATYASTGAAYGYSLLWVMVIVTFSLSLVQEMCARMGAVTGKGLSDLIREQFGVGWSLFAVFVLLIANTGVTISEFVGIAAAAELFGIPRWIVVPIVALLVWWLVTKGSYKTVERIFMVFTLVFISYFFAAFLAKPDWSQVGLSLVTPTFPSDPAALTVVVALIGTTITPYMQVFVQSSVVEKGVTPVDYKYTRFDTVFGAILSDIVSIFIIIATAATLWVSGHTEVGSAADAAQALQPVAGESATIMFAVGLFGASMLAAGVLPLATAYSVTEALGFEKGVSMSFEQAPVFMWLFTGLIALGALVAIIPGLPLFAVLILVQILNGTLLPILLFFIIRLASNREIMGQYAIGRVYKVFAWGTMVVITIAVVLMLITLFIGG